jgi:hypothetical protein
MEEEIKMIRNQEGSIAGISEYSFTQGAEKLLGDLTEKQNSDKKTNQQFLQNKDNLTNQHTKDQRGKAPGRAPRPSEELPKTGQLVPMHKKGSKKTKYIMIVEEAVTIDNQAESDPDDQFIVAESMTDEQSNHHISQQIANAYPQEDSFASRENRSASVTVISRIEQIQPTRGLCSSRKEPRKNQDKKISGESKKKKDENTKNADQDKLVKQRKKDCALF